MEPQTKKHKNAGILFGSLVIVGVIASIVFIGKKPIDGTVANVTDNNSIASSDTSTSSQKSSGGNTVVTTIPPADVPKKTTTTPTYAYKNGTYSATGSYMSPGGQDQIDVTLTLVNDVITNVSAVANAGDRTSQRYENMFISNFQQYVVGKNISTVYLSRVSGSSLTPNGFNDAIAQIKAQAKA